MILNHNDIEEFIRAWREAFREDLTFEEARIAAMRTLDLYWTISRCRTPHSPISKHQLP